MSEQRPENPFALSVGENPYAVAPAAESVGLADGRRHEMGNATAANLEARSIAEVKAQVLMARQFPRDPHAAVERILRECERPTLAEKATYTFPRGRETVSGPSIRLAEMMARNWGNNAFGQEVIERTVGEDGVGKSAIRAFAWDLESNTYISRQFEVRHWRETQSGGYALTGDRDIYEIEANMGSRRVRACLLQMLPGDVMQAAVDRCRMIVSDALVSAMGDKTKRGPMIARMVKAFEPFGITLADLEAYLSARMADWTADHALRMKELKNGLDDGVISLADAIPRLAALGQNDKISAQDAEALMEAVKATGRQGDIQKRLKALGIAKIAATPLDKLDEVRKIVAEYAATEDRE